MEPRELQRRRWIRTRERSVEFIVTGVLMAALLLWSVTTIPNHDIDALDIFAALLLLALGVRAGLMGVLPEMRGVRIRNPLRTHRIAWSQIEDFRVEPYGLAPKVGVVVYQGRRRPIVGIAGPNPLFRAKNRAAEKNVEELTHLLNQARANGGTLGP